MSDEDEEKEEFTGLLVDESDINEIKKRKIKRIILIVGVLLVIAAIAVTLYFVLKDSDKNKEDSDSGDNKDPKYDIIMKESDFITSQSTTKKIQLIKLKESNYTFILVHDPKTINAGIEFRTNFGFSTEV